MTVSCGTREERNHEYHDTKVWVDLTQVLRQVHSQQSILILILYSCFKSILHNFFLGLSILSVLPACLPNLKVVGNRNTIRPREAEEDPGFAGQLEPGLKVLPE
jgi:hypothetical protein